ncbi:hypothetical protein D3C78_1386500 [compost metagenome]
MAMRTGDVLSFVVGLGGDDVHPGDHVRLLQMLAGPEVGPVMGDRLHQEARSEMRGEGVGQAELCREIGTLQAGAKNPHRHIMAAG